MSTVDLERVVTTGASGMIGNYVDFGLRPTQAELDMTNEAQVREYLHTHQPSAILHLAAAADGARCEAEPAYAYDQNVRGTYNLALAARDIGARFVYVSTTRVFKGDKETPYTETDTPDPITQYARTKHVGELIVQQLIPHHLIVRTAWVFGGGPERDNKFYGNVIRQLRSDTPDIKALTDVTGSPTYARDLVEAIEDLLREGATGIVHVTNTGTASRYDLAVALAKEIGADAPVQAVDRSHFPDAVLPANEAVVSDRCTLRPWQEALTEYVAAEWK